MKAIVQVKYGSPDVLRLEDIDKPVAKDDEVLVRVHAAAVNIGDWHLLRGVPYAMRLASGLLKPKREIPGLVGLSAARTVSGAMKMGDPCGVALERRSALGAGEPEASLVCGSPRSSGLLP